MIFTESERKFYARQLQLHEVGDRGQSQLKQSSVLVIGVGGLGSPLALYLAAAGVGRIGLVEDDLLDATNLQRQIIYEYAQIGQAKIECAVKRLKALNPFIDIVAHSARFDSDHSRNLIEQYDIIADCSDNFDTRYLVNRVCLHAGRTVVSAAVRGLEGQVAVFNQGGSACYECLYPRPAFPEAGLSCAETGVLGVVTGVMGSLQASEVLRILLGLYQPSDSNLLTFDIETMTLNKVHLERDPNCAACGASSRPSINRANDRDNYHLRNEYVDPVEAIDLLNSKTPPLLIDFRDITDGEDPGIEPSIKISADQLYNLDLQTIKDREVIVYCQTGQRSGYAAFVLRERGLGSARSLLGGYEAFKKSNPRA